MPDPKPSHLRPSRRCASSLGAPELTIEALAALGAKYGLQAIELRVLEKRLDLPVYLKDKYKTPEAFGEAMRKLPVEIVQLGTSFNLMHSSEADLEQVYAFVPWAEAAGVSYLRIFDGKGPVDSENLAVAGQVLRRWEERAKSEGWKVRLLVETHSSLLTGAAVRELLAFHPGAEILWDAHHTWKQGGESPKDTWAAISSAVRHVHIKDSVPKPQPKQPYTYVLPGDGDFPISETLQCLTAFSGCVSLEWEKQWHPGLPSLEDALRVAEERRWW